VEWVSDRILRRMSYVQMAREEVMDETNPMTELCEWSVWDEIIKKMPDKGHQKRFYLNHSPPTKWLEQKIQGGATW
jgi:myosin-crossreactive antigen